MHVLILLASAAALLVAPRHLALVPLIAGSVYLTKGEGLDLGGITLHFHRILLAVGMLRVLSRGELQLGEFVIGDKIVALWAGWSIFASFFHEQAAGSGMIYTAGVVFNVTAGYFLVRCLCRDYSEVRRMIGALALILVPVALAMTYEKLTGNTVLGSPEVIVRDGEIRAHGSFRHPILAGTVGAALLPLMVGIWRESRGKAILGGLACLIIVATCHSSGPLISLIAGIAIVGAWKFHRYAGLAAKGAVLLYLALDLITERPAYFGLLARLDLTGSSTTYYRARMIDTATRHLHEWWLFGTDYTAHWIPEGIGSIILGGKHMDITNYYIGFGVAGGLIGMFCVLLLVFSAIRKVVVTCNDEFSVLSDDNRFLFWCLGAALGAFALSGMSVAFFDQTENLFWMLAALIMSFVARQDELEADEVDADEIEVLDCEEEAAVA